MLAKNVWQIKDGKPVAMKDGQPIYGKNGEPITQAEWLLNLRVEEPLLFEQSSGGDAAGSRRSNGTTSKARSKMTPKEKADYIGEHGQEQFLQLPL